MSPSHIQSHPVTSSHIQSHPVTTNIRNYFSNKVTLIISDSLIILKSLIARLDMRVIEIIWLLYRPPPDELG